MFILLLHTFLLIALTIHFSRSQMVLDRRFYWGGLSIRLVAGITFGLIYTYCLKEGDTLVFFQKASELANQAVSDPISYLDYLFSTQYPIFKSEARDGFFVKIVSVFCLITNNNYWLTTAYFSLFSFLAVWRFINLLTARFVEHKWSLVFAFLILPSPIFWTSGILKDCLIASALFLVCFTFCKLYFGQRLKPFDIIFTTLAFFILWNQRYFLFGLCVMLISILLVYRFALQRMVNPFLKSGTLVGLFLIGIIGISSMNQNLYFSHFPQAIYDNFITIKSNSAPAESLQFEEFQPTWGNLLIHLPQSLVAGLFRPFPGEGGWKYLPHTIEHFCLLILVLYSFIKIKTAEKPNSLIISALIFILILATLFPLASPNFGTLMRYKAIYSPLAFYLATIIPFNFWFRIEGIKR